MPPKRSAPSEPAKNFEIGDTKEGLNGKLYIVFEDKNGNKRWKTAPNQPEKSNDVPPDDPENEGEDNLDESGGDDNEDSGDDNEDEDYEGDDEDDEEGDEDDEEDDEEDYEEDDEEDDEEDEDEPRVERDYSIIFNFYKAPNDDNRLFFRHERI